MPVFQAPYLQGLAQAVFEAAGAKPAVAMTVAEFLVEADLMGHDSHGIIRIPEYLKEMKTGKISPNSEPGIVRETATTMQVDGKWGFGQIVATWTVERLASKANEAAVAAATIAHCGHIGRVGAYPEMLARRGLIGFAYVNGGGNEPRVAPFGGRKPIFGTNPLAAALPVTGRPPIVLDFSTAVVASGKIRVARDRGEVLPDGWILDREGRPSRDPKDYYSGGMLVPAAGHKGYALSLFVEALGGVLSGAGTLLLPESGYRGGNGVFLVAVNPGAFRPVDEFAADMRGLAQAVKGTPAAPGTAEVLLPGEPEEKNKQQRLREGIPVADATWKAVTDAAKSVGVSPAETV